MLFFSSNISKLVHFGLIISHFSHENVNTRTFLSTQEQFFRICSAFGKELQHSPALCSRIKSLSCKTLINLCISLIMFYTLGRPYLWGSAGSSHYSIKSNLSLTLSTQPSVDSVIECLDRDLLHKSAYNLPLHRQLSPGVSHYQ